MADLNEKLGELHEAVTEAVLERFQSGEATNDDLRVAMQLLKQNAVTAAAPEASPLRSLASKLDFSAMAEKVVPLKRPEPPTDDHPTAA
jgi:hypothetical protein